MLKRYLVKGLLFIIVFLFLTGAKVLYMERSHFTAAEKYYAASNWKLAIREYDAALHFYFPGSPYVGKSAERLWQIGEMFEKADKPDWAILAYSSIRSSFYASRSLYTPGKEWIARCDDKIAALDVQMLVKEGSLKPEESEAEKKKLLYVMKVDRAPDPVWSILVETSFFGWILSVLYTIWKAFDHTGKLRKRSALYGLLFFVATFGLWVISLLKA
ncbi:MAG: hypothetical protein M0Z71_07995 [Nitrospiraceae bacterium]|nr:hypothetical protein [Nitrospiraceae bacterium]